MKNVGMVLAGCSLLFLAACASVDVSQMPQSGRYMIVTRFGGGFAFEKIGTTLFNNDFQVFQDDADPGKAFRDSIVATLDRDSSWKYVPTDTKLPSPKYDPSIDKYKNAIDGDVTSAAAELQTLKQAAAANHVDLVMVVTEISHGDTLGGTNQSVSGRGVYQRTFAGLDDRTYNYIAYAIRVYDARNWNELEYSTLFVNKNTGFAWPKNGTAIPADIVQSGKQAVAALAPPSDIPFALCYLGLTQYGKSPDNHTRAYGCVQHYGIQSIGFSLMNVNPYWLTHPPETGHADLHN